MQHRIRAKSATGSGGGGPCPPCLPGFTDSDGFNIKFSDSNAAPTDAASFAIALALSDTNAGQTEALQLKFPPPDFADVTPAPTDTNNFTMRCWLSASAGGTNPANANGSNNGTVATLQTAVLGTNPLTLTSTLGANIPTAIITSVLYRGWFQSANVLVTSTGSLIMHSTSALFTDVVMFSNSGLSSTINHLSGTFTFDLLAAGINTLAKLQSCQMLHRVQDAVAGVTPHTLTCDAGCVEISGAF